MIWAVMALSASAVGLAVRMYFLGRSVEKYKAQLKGAEKRALAFADQFEELKRRSEARIEKLKGTNKKLLDEFIESGRPGDFRNSLNGLFQDEDN